MAIKSLFDCDQDLQKQERPLHSARHGASWWYGGGRATYQHGIQNGEPPIAKIIVERDCNAAACRATLSAKSATS